jgi:hypothetical protein
MLEMTQPPRGDMRERLLESAEAAVLAKGFAATSIEEFIAAVGITKSGQGRTRQGDAAALSGARQGAAR